MTRYLLMIGALVGAVWAEVDTSSKRPEAKDPEAIIGSVVQERTFTCPENVQAEWDKRQQKYRITSDMNGFSILKAEWDSEDQFKGQEDIDFKFESLAVTPRRSLCSYKDPKGGTLNVTVIVAFEIRGKTTCDLRNGKPVLKGNKVSGGVCEKDLPGQCPFICKSTVPQRSGIFGPQGPKAPSMEAGSIIPQDKESIAI